MARRIVTGIDIGTYQVKIVVVEEVRDKRGSRALRVLGTGLAESRGLRQGYLVNKEEVTASVRAAKQQAEETAGVLISAGFLAIGGISLDEARATGEAIVSRADQEVTELDLEAAAAKAKEAAQPAFLNRRVMHDIPTESRLDGSKVLGSVLGMRGLRLEVDHLYVTCLAQHEEALVEAVEAADIEVLDQMASPLAGSYVLLTNDQKLKGCVLANIGTETVSIVVYDEGIPISVKVFPIGSGHITDDIAVGLRISLEEAERVKLGRLTGSMYPRRRVEDFIETRLSAMFALVDKHLRSLNRRGPLPAGIILSGGGSGIGQVSDIAKSSLKLPAKIADIQVQANAKLRDATWAVAYGLALWGLTGDTGTPRRGARAGFSKFFRQFLP
ncbi:MAG: cell division FtsA domain-containing protein [Minisyncoccia bacterium]